MPDIMDLLRKWWKQMLSVVLLSLITVGILVFLQPRKYLSVTTAIPATSVAADKSRIFNENIHALYSNLGLPEDLDIIVGTGQLDTVYLAVTDQFNLYDHYKTKEQGEAARRKAAFLLKKNTRVIKSDYNELKVKVWDIDKNLAAQLANTILEKIHSIHQDAQNKSNVLALSVLKNGLQKIRDSLLHINAAQDELAKNSLENQSLKYQQLIGEYQLMVESKPPVLLVVESARPAEWPDKPRRAEIIIVTGIISLLFAFMLTLVLEKRNQSAQ
jgi:uncharacterized protein involved in exopolysaccharide biosynthesis